MNVFRSLVSERGILLVFNSPWLALVRRVTTTEPTLTRRSTALESHISHRKARTMDPLILILPRRLSILWLVAIIQYLLLR